MTDHAPEPVGDQPLVWGRVAAVRRTLEWVYADPRRAETPFLGSNCSRLLDEALTIGGDSITLRHRIELVRDALAGLGTADTAARVAALDRARTLLDGVLPLPEAGATVMASEPAAHLVVPRRRRGGPWKDRDDESGAGEDEGLDEGLDELGEDLPAAEARPGPLPAVARGGADPEDEAGVELPPAPPAKARREPSLEELLEQAQRELKRREKAGAPAPRVEVLPIRHPFPHEERGGLPLSALPGVAPEVALALAEEGVQTVSDLLLTAPQEFDRKPILRLGEELPEEELMIRGPVLSRCTRLSPGARRHEVVIGTREGHQVVVRWVGSPPRGFESWGPGAEIALVGSVEIDELTSGDQVRAICYEAEPVGIDGRGSGHQPRYGFTGVDERTARDVVARALALILDQVKDTLPGPILERQRLLPIDEALRDAHFPANTTGRGRTRMAFEELFLLQLGIALRGGKVRTTRGNTQRALHGYLGQLELEHGIVLDDGQERAFDEIKRDLCRATPMTRLLQGDVGAGKGLIALMTAIVVAENRAQVAVVCPDSLTAERRFLFAETVLRSVGITPLLVSDRVTHAQADAIRRGEAHVVYGTIGLLDEALEWRRLGLVVGEERDRYGTIDPARLPGRTHRPDLLVLTAAPIPTSLAFSVFGDFDLSVVPRHSATRAVPRVLHSAERGQAYELVREQVAKGHQAYVVFPVAKGRDLLGPEDARRFSEALRQELLPDARIAVYASAMTREERVRVFDDFRHRRFDVLVSTTYVEDAPAVDNATIVVVEHADRHTLVRLHRLRGHLRHGSCCFVLGEAPSEEGRRIVQLASEESDGFRLAEIDLQVRGVEALLGDRATEAPDLAWADPPEDRALLLRARAEALDLVRADPELRRWKTLTKAVSTRWGEWLGEGGGAESEASGARRPPSSRRRRRRRRR